MPFFSKFISLADTIYMSNRANPANLASNDSVYDIFNKIVTSGNAANGVSKKQSECAIGVLTR
jgi:hypothetical protein